MYARGTALAMDVELPALTIVHAIQRTSPQKTAISHPIRIQGAKLCADSSERSSGVLTGRDGAREGSVIAA